VLCVFDVNETLLDLAGLDEFFTDLTGTPEARREWFGLLIHSALTLTAARQYRKFGEIAAASLPPVAARHGRTATPDHQRELGARLRQLPPHPDAAEALKSLRDAGSAVVTLTNSTLEVAEDQVRNAGLRDLLDGVYSADEAGLLKPAPEPYRHVLERRGVSPADAVLVAAHDWDVAGAAAAGMRTAFIGRDGQVPLPTADAPTITATSLRDVAAQLTRLPGMPG
jgi:2-haloacid dehalogenase